MGGQLATSALSKARRAATSSWIQHTQEHVPRGKVQYILGSTAALPSP